MKDYVEESMQEKNLACEKDEAKTATSGSKVDSKSSIPTYVPSPPFPDRLSKNLQLCKDIVETVASLESLPSIPPRYNISYITLPISKEKLLPSVMHAPTLEFKSLPKHLKYVYLGEGETLW
ncbi:Hypothetical predicted protein [Olea europaea subsp. europaea]|uniref:Uncharacterized protein n=1 Tax=Olea europaea subsp. europaea TaxID=158383 RepID=A0A8S0RB45_OLEEU|nr:Hypothetical predicted protein [Olea europaea subsp. europaea]